MDMNDPRVARLPRWAQDVLRDQSREIDSLKRSVAQLEALGNGKRLAERYSGSEQHPTVDGLAFLGRNVVGTVPVGIGRAYDFIRWQCEDGSGALRGGRTVSLSYSGNGRLVILPHASNTVHLGVVYDR